MRRRRSSKTGPVIVILLLVIGTIVALNWSALGRGTGLPSFSPAVQAATPTPSRPDSSETARKFFQLWDQGQYDQMYALLSEAARAQTPQDRFVTRYRNITNGAGLISVSAQPGTSQPGISRYGVDRTASRVSYTAKWESTRLGKFGEDGEMSLVLEDDKWQVEWSPALIFKGLNLENSVRMVPDDPIRGDIVDRQGRLMGGLGKVLDIGLIPGRIQEEAKVLAALSSYLEMKPEAIKARYVNARPDWWVPLKQLPLAKADEAKAKLGELAGIGIREQDARIYPAGQIGAHVVGYVSRVNAEDLKTLSRKGYDEADFVGRDGIEAQMEDALAGEKGGSLVILGPDGKPIKTVAERQAKPGAKIQLTIDLDIQRKAEEALGEKTGSIVAIDPRDHTILALVSHPAYDPNAFLTGMSEADWKKLSDDKRLPFQTRPTMSGYPTGSVFKVITMAAGLEKGGFRPDSQFDSPGQWKLPGSNQVFRDWLPEGHGRLSLVDGLAQSANPVFYEIGYKLYTMDPNILPSFAAQFGLGAKSGIVGLPENAGVLPGPEWKKRTLNDAWYPGDAVNLAIGQGYLEATPLQVANVYAALADGGNLRAPLLVKSVTDSSGKKEFSSDLKNKLPVSPESLAAIYEGMKRTVVDPRGTANYAFKGFRIPTAAKTGSAENQHPDAHAWFAGFAPVDKPEVVVVVMVEGGKAGGEVAAPLGRKFLESYFAGR